MAYFIQSPTRVGRSQGASLFWGLISTCFAAAACYFFWKNAENERTANVMRDQAMQLREENESLQAQKTHLQASKIEAEGQLKTREDLIQEKEAALAAEELRLDGLSRQSANPSAQNGAQVALVRRFNEVIKKLGKDAPSDVVERAGRPVLRVPNAQLFAPGDATLKPEGKALLTQINQAVGGQIDAFELRLVCYTDTEAEAVAGAIGKDAGAKDAGVKKDAADPSLHAASWTLTANRATTLARYYREQTSLPFLNITVSARGDCEPIASNTGDNHTRNRRVEISILPQPTPLHLPEADKLAAPIAGTPAAVPAPGDPALRKDRPKEKKADKPPSAGPK